jgi:formylglycine-generating enzyme required for sulfatase activity
MPKAKNWAIVVGINQYDNIGQLKYANRDAEAIATFFRSSGFDRVFCFADGLEIVAEKGQRSTAPRSSDLVDFLHDRFTTPTPPLKPGDNCWFFFAGHGKRIKDADYLLPLDYNPRLENHETRAIRVDFVREALLKSGADNVILLLDACRTEGDRADGVGIGDGQPGAITIFSCERNKSAYEIDELRHGAFTAALLEGLQMPKSAENCATVQRLNRYLRDRVPQLCKLHPEKPSQNPNTIVDPGEKWYLLLLPKVATEQDIVALENKAQGAELAENLDLAEQLWIRCVAATGGEDLNALDGYARVRGKKANRRSTLTLPTQAADVTSKASRSTDYPAPKPAPSKLSFSFHSITVDETGKEIDRKPGTAYYFSEDLWDDVTLDMVEIPGGMFQMGAVQGEEWASADEYPRHWVTITPFYMGKFAVTQAQWRSIAQLPKVKIELEVDPSCFKGAKRPVEQVSWPQAIEFCDRLSRETRKNYRLPSEAQWEYACRAGTTTPFHFGATITTKLVNFRGGDLRSGDTVRLPGKYAKAPFGESRKNTIDVGTFAPNSFGLYDMHGNVWEWCQDKWHNSYDRAPNDGSFWRNQKEQTRITRGGSWLIHPHHCRSANRGCSDRAAVSSAHGFRVICLPL